MTNETVSYTQAIAPDVVAGRRIPANPTPAELEQVERALVDASTRKPVMFFFTTAQTWLLAATVFGIIASVKMHAPGFLGHASWLTFGRVWPAFMNTLVYGWAIPVGVGVGIWMLARLCRVTLRTPLVPIIGGIFWNIGVTIGVISILAGNMRPFELLEFPRYSATLLFIALSLIAVWAVIMYRKRRAGFTYVSMLYLVGAFFWLPWLYGAANVLVGNPHIRGVVQGAVAAWYAQGLLGYWFMAIGLGAIYYLIPKVIGRPINSYYLATLGFWTFAVFWGFTPMVRLAGGPYPSWYSAVSIAASILMLIPVALVTLNYAATMRGSYHMVYHSPTIRFTMYGAIAWSLTVVLGAFSGLRSLDRFTHFTQFGVGQMHLLIYAFYSMVMFGSMYYIVPRLVGCEWLSPTFIRIHFWGAGYGIGLMIIVLLIGGAAQGATWADPQIDATQIVQKIEPYMIGRVIAWIPLAIAHFLFFLHFLAMLLRLGIPSGEATLFAPITPIAPRPRPESETGPAPRPTGATEPEPQRAGGKPQHA